MLIASLLLAASVDPVLAHYEKHEAKHLVPMLSEVIRFSTHQFDPEAHAAQKAWLMQVAKDMNFVARDAGIGEVDRHRKLGALEPAEAVHRHRHQQEGKDRDRK